MTQSILIVDDEAPMRERLRRILGTLGHANGTLRCASNLAEGKAQAGGNGEFAMALVDLGLPDGNGIELIGWLRAQSETLPILVISAWSTEEMILGALRAGASGYVLKERDDMEIALSLKNVLAGGAPIDPFIARRILGLIHEPAPTPAAAEDAATLRRELSEREQEILARVAGGMSNREIADMLSISKATVDTHVQHIYRKLAVKSRLQAINAARAHGLLQ